jgi:hypothetical protein
MILMAAADEELPGKVTADRSKPGGGMVEVCGRTPSCPSALITGTDRRI